jgi:putative MATE family efflux protein
MHENTRILGEEKVSRLLWRFSIPAIIGTLANSIYVIIDRMFVGNIVGTDAIAGMSITMPISFVIMAFGMLIGLGSAAQVSIRLGRQQKDEAEQILGNAVILVIIITVTLTAFFLTFLDEALTLFGASPDILPYARQFISIILYGSVFQHILFGLANIIRAQGNPRMAMTIQLCNAIMNVFLDFVFIYLLGWGIKGVAIATIISQGISATWVLVYLSSSRSLLRLSLGKMRLKPDLLREIVAIGMAPFSMQLIASVVNILYNQGLSRYGGDTAVGAFGIIASIVMFVLMIIIGINQGAQPIIGYNYGARRYQRVRETLRKAVTAATVVVTIGFIIMMLFPRLILSGFTSDLNLLTIGSRGLRLWILFLPVLGLQIVGASFFQAIGRARQALLLSVSRQLLFLIPMLLVLPRIWGLDGVFLAGSFADGGAAVLTFFVLLAELKRIKREPENQPV